METKKLTEAEFDKLFDRIFDTPMKDFAEFSTGSGLPENLAVRRTFVAGIISASDFLANEMNNYFEERGEEPPEHIEQFCKRPMMYTSGAAVLGGMPAAKVIESLTEAFSGNDETVDGDQPS